MWLKRYKSHWLLLDNRVRTVFLSPALLASEPCPDRIKLVHGSLNEDRIVCEYARLEVPGSRTLHPDTGPGQVGGAEVGDLGVEDEDLEMHAGAEHAFQPGEKDRIPVEILTEVGPRFLGVDKTNFAALRDQIGQQTQERPVADIEVLDVGRTDPQGALDLGNPGKDLLEVGFVRDILCHICKFILFQRILNLLSSAL